MTDDLRELWDRAERAAAETILLVVDAQQRVEQSRDLLTRSAELAAEMNDGWPRALRTTLG
jgi:hypothetical protein